MTGRGGPRGLLVGALVVLGVLVGAGTALAHNVLIGTDPVDGASLDTGPARVLLRFDLPVQRSFDTVTVIGPDGGQYQDGPPRVEGATVSVAVRALGPAGRYTIGYRVISDDGHPVSGSVGFTLTRPGGGRPGPPLASAPAPDPDSGSGGMPAWPWIVGAVVLVAGGAAVASRAGRR